MIYSINEGQQAEEYKARKAKEAEAESKKYDKYKGDATTLGSRIGAGNKSGGIHPDGNGGFRLGSNDDNNRDSKSTDIVYKDLDRRKSDLSKSTTIEDFEKHASSLNNLSSNLHAAADATNRHIRRHPDQYKESYGIFSEIEFLNENRARKHMKEIKHSAGYKGMKELLKKASKSKDPKDKVEAALECIRVLDDLIEAAKDIPKNDFGDSFINVVRWIPLTIITTLLGVPQAVVDTSQTKDEFINYLLRLKVKCIKIYEKNKALI